jgi:hypothetical protein
MNKVPLDQVLLRVHQSSPTNHSTDILYSSISTPEECAIPDQPEHLESSTGASHLT